MSKSLEALEVIECILSNHQTMLEAKDKRFEFINTIKQDLERLEVLKKHLIEIQLGLRQEQVLKVKGVQGIVLIKDFENEEDFNKIREWLNNNE